MSKDRLQIYPDYVVYFQNGARVSWEHFSSESVAISFARRCGFTLKNADFHPGIVMKENTFLIPDLGLGVDVSSLFTLAKILPTYVQHRVEVWVLTYRNNLTANSIRARKAEYDRLTLTRSTLSETDTHSMETTIRNNPSRLAPKSLLTAFTRGG